MTRTLPPLLVVLLATSCVRDRSLIEPVAQARAELVAETAQPAAHAAVGMTALGAALCGYSLEDWQGMGTSAPQLPSDLVAWFSVDPSGVMHAYPARGQYEITWSDGSFFGQDVSLKVTVGTPMSAFTVYLSEPGDAGQDDTGPSETGIGQSEGEILASAVLSSSGCGDGDHLVSGNLSFPVSGDYSWDVTVQGAEDEDGMAFEEDALYPSRGSMSWSGIAEFGRATLVTDDASTIADLAWPATASGRGWESTVDLSLAADD